MADLSLTGATICDRVEAYTGITTVSNALTHVNAGYRRFLAGYDPRTNQAHVWSFLKPIAQIDVGGSANAVASRSSTYVMASSGITFNPSMVGLTITVMSADSVSNLEVEITKYISTSTAQVNSSAAWTRGSCTCSVASDGIADLPTDFDGILDPFIYPYYDSEDTPDLEEVSPETILRAWRMNNGLDDPRMFAVVPTALTAATGQRHKAYVAPRPEEVRTLQYRYLVRPDALTDAGTYPLGGPRHSETIKYAALAAAEMETGKVEGPMERRFRELMAASIDADMNLFETHDVESIHNGGID